MIARRTKHLKLGLLPRMDAHPLKAGGFSFRYKTHDGKYIPLGRDQAEAMKKALDLINGRPLNGSLAELVADYFKSAQFRTLAPRTQKDYESDSRQVLRVFGQMAPAGIEAPHIAQYLRVERSDAPVRANREMAFLSTVLSFGIDLGILKQNPCRQVRRNKEKPRTRRVELNELESVLAIANAKGGSSELIGIIAKFCAITGQRREDVLHLRLAEIGEKEIRIQPRKTKADEAQVTISLPITEGLRELIDRAKALPRTVRGLHLFCNRQGQSYTDSGFLAIWNRIQQAHAKAGGKRFTFHDLRAYYVTEGKERGINVTEATGHKSDATANRIYDRRRVRKATPLE